MSESQRRGESNNTADLFSRSDINSDMSRKPENHNAPAADLQNLDREKKIENLTQKVANGLNAADLPQILQHIRDLEDDRSTLKQKLAKMEESNKKLGQKTRQGMQSMLDTVIKHWLDAANTNADIREKTYKGLDNLVKAGDEENGVWQMMVSASALNKQQEDKLENLLQENAKLKTQIDNFYGSASSRTVQDREVGSKFKAETELSRNDVESDQDIWTEFQNLISY